LAHGKLDCVILDFEKSIRLVIQCMPTVVGANEEIGVLALRSFDGLLKNEMSLKFDPVTILNLERITANFANTIVTVGIRFLDKENKRVDIICGQELASLAVFGWGFLEGDQNSEVSLDEYSFDSW
jgi:hypothetical protein